MKRSQKEKKDLFQKEQIDCQLKMLNTLNKLDSENKIDIILKMPLKCEILNADILLGIFL